MVKPFDDWVSIGKAEQIERVEQLDRVLTEMTAHERRKHFDMESWGYKNDCGTVGCAAGRAAFDPWFRRRGFVLTVVDHPDDEGNFSMDFTHLEPNHVFGDELSDNVFTNGRFMVAGEKAYRAVRRALRAYIALLRAQEAQEEARQALERAEMASHRARVKFADLTEG